MIKWMHRLGWLVGILALGLATLWLGTFVHESGHALVAAAFGAHLDEMNVVALNLYPTLRLNYIPGYFGWVRYSPSLLSPEAEYVSAAGSLNTMTIAVLAQITFWVRPPRRTWSRLVVTSFCLWWIDAVWHTSAFMLNLRSDSHAEMYNALVALGGPEGLVKTAVLGLSALLLTLTAARWWQLTRRDSPSPENA